MPKITLNTIGSRYGSIDALNDNFDAIEAAFENTFSRDGEGPNTLQATVDANSQRIVNLPNPVGNTEPATKGWILAQPGQAAASAVAAANSAAAAAISEANAEESASIVADWEWKDEWATGEVYVVNNIVAVPSGTYEGWSFICVVGHTASAAFDTDFGAGKWDVLAKRGSAGAGTGDMLAANNLSDLTNLSAARTNLSVPSVTGGGASGNWGINITGNAATATNATNASTVTTITTGQTQTAIAGSNFGDLGTTVIAWNNTTSSVSSNGTIAGSNLRYRTSGTANMFTNAGGTEPTAGGSALSGTWKNMGGLCNGRTQSGSGGFDDPIFYSFYPSLWLRIA
jgi:hypothetical protein